VWCILVAKFVIDICSTVEFNYIAMVTFCGSLVVCLVEYRLVSHKKCAMSVQFVIAIQMS